VTTHTPQLGERWSESSWSTVTSSNAALTGTHPQRRHEFVHLYAANAATENMTQEAYSNIVRKFGILKSKKQQAVGCAYIHITVNSPQLTMSSTAYIVRGLRDKFITARNRKPATLTKAFVHTVGEITHHNVVSSRIFADEFCYKHPQQWTRLALIMLEECTEADIVEVIAKYHH